MVDALEDHLFTELEFRAAFILQEAALLARHARRACVSAADVALAHKSLSGGRGGGGPWSQHPGSAAARLLLSAGPLRVAPLSVASLLGDGEGGEGGGAAALAGSREAAATLAAVTAALGASLRGGSAEEFAGLLAGLVEQPGVQLARLMPAVVSSLRAALEGLLLAPALAAGGGGGAPDAQQLHCLLHIVAGVAAHRGLPVEECAGELLALLASLLLHQGGGGAGEPAAAAAAGQQLREQAAEAFVDFVGRAAVQWPPVVEQASALLLDAAVSAAIVGGGADAAAGGGGGGCGGGGGGGAGPAPGKLRVAISAPAPLLGALAALARLPGLPPAQRPLLLRLLTTLEAHWEEAEGGGACGAGLGGAAALDSWEGAARRMCARAQRRHFGEALAV